MLPWSVDWGTCAPGHVFGAGAPRAWMAGAGTGFLVIVDRYYLRAGGNDPQSC
jgi:hypothetical protein